MDGFSNFKEVKCLKFYQEFNFYGSTVPDSTQLDSTWHAELFSTLLYSSNSNLELSLLLNPWMDFQKNKLIEILLGIQIL